jgi:hypothetical protein
MTPPRKLTEAESAPLAKAAIDQAACELIQERRVVYFRLRRIDGDELLPALPRAELIARAREIAPREVRRYDLYAASRAMFRCTPWRGYFASTFDATDLRPLGRSRVLVLLDERPVREANTSATTRAHAAVARYLRRRRRQV